MEPAAAPDWTCAPPRATRCWSTCGLGRLHGRARAPGDPHVSVLYQKLEGDPATGARMPFGGEALPPAQRLLIHDWIEQGAHNN